MKKIKTRSQKGFTLVEILLYMALSVSFMGVLTKMFLDTLDVKQDSKSTNAIETDSRFVLDRMMYDVARADSVSIPLSPGQTSSSLVFVADGITYTYVIDGEGSLVIMEGVTPYKLTGADITVTDISFTRVGNVGGVHTFQVAFDMESKIIEASGVEQRSYQTTLGLR